MRTSGSAASVAATVLPDPLPAVVQHFADLHAGLTELAAIADQKLTALRAADADALQRCTAREAAVLQRVLGAEQRRPALLARVAQSLQRPELVSARLNEIADHVPEPAASSLRARGLALRDIAGRLQRKNRLAALVARNLQGHLRDIFAAVAKAAQDSVVYGPQGRQHASDPRCWVDAVG